MLAEQWCAGHGQGRKMSPHPRSLPLLHLIAGVGEKAGRLKRGGKRVR